MQCILASNVIRSIMLRSMRFFWNSFVTIRDVFLPSFIFVGLLLPKEVLWITRLTEHLAVRPPWAPLAATATALAALASAFAFASLLRAFRRLDSLIRTLIGVVALLLTLEAGNIRLRSLLLCCIPRIEISFVVSRLGRLRVVGLPTVISVISPLTRESPTRLSRTVRDKNSFFGYFDRDLRGRFLNLFHYALDRSDLRAVVFD